MGWDIVNNWKKTTLGEVIYPVSETFDFTGKDVVHFLNTGDILDGKLLHNDFVKVEFLPGQAKKSFLLGDILYSEIRPANKRYMLVDFDSSNSVASTKLMVLRTKGGIDKKFIYQILTSDDTLKEFQFIAESRSGTFPQITFEAISFFPILLPSLPEQKAIAGILSSFDDKIELLRRQNKTLEQIAQTIFKEWFVNFKVKSEQLKINSTTGLPEGWRMGKYGELADVTTGKGLKKEFIKEKGKYSVLGANGELGKTDDYLFDEDLILTGRVGTLGTVYISRSRAWISDNVLISKMLSAENFYFAYYNLKRLNFESLNRGSTQPLITQTDLKNVEIVIPKKEVLESWHNIASSMFMKIFNDNSQIQTLSKLRDALLPKLMKGEIRVNL